MSRNERMMEKKSQVPFYFLFAGQLTTPMPDALNRHWTTKIRGFFAFIFFRVARSENWMLLSMRVQGLALGVRLGVPSMEFGLCNNSGVCTLCPPMMNQKSCLTIRLWNFGSYGWRCTPKGGEPGMYVKVGKPGKCGLNSDHVPYGFLSGTNKVQVSKALTGSRCWLLCPCTGRGGRSVWSSSARGQLKGQRERAVPLLQGQKALTKEFTRSPRNSVPKSQIM